MTTALLGCVAKIETIKNPIEVDETEYARLFNAAVVVLREKGFTVDQQDYRYGRVTTRPARSPTFLEPWHADNTTFDQGLMSTINHQRRRISLYFEPKQAEAGRLGEGRSVGGEGTGGDYLFHAEILVERLVVPVARLTGSTRPRGLIGKLSDVPVEWKERGIQDAYWRIVGRDPFLEQRLIAEIIRRSMWVEADVVGDGI